MVKISSRAFNTHFRASCYEHNYEQGPYRGHKHAISEKTLPASGAELPI